MNINNKICIKKAGYKLNMQNINIFINANKNQLEDIMEKKSPFTLAMKKIKCIGINVSRNM